MENSSSSQVCAWPFPEYTQPLCDASHKSNKEYNREHKAEKEKNHRNMVLSPIVFEYHGVADEGIASWFGSQLRSWCLTGYNLIEGDINQAQHGVINRLADTWY